MLPPLTYGFSPLPRYADEISVNDAVLAAYLHSVLPAVADPGDDHNYGSTVLCDVTLSWSWLLCNEKKLQRLPYTSCLLRT